MGSNLHFCCRKHAAVVSFEKERNMASSQEENSDAERLINPSKKLAPEWSTFGVDRDHISQRKVTRTRRSETQLFRLCESPKSTRMFLVLRT
jgi:hypothetical protein